MFSASTLITLAAIAALPITIFVVLKFIKDMQVLPNGAPVRLQEQAADLQHQHEVNERKFQHEFTMEKMRVSQQALMQPQREITEEDINDE